MRIELGTLKVSKEYSNIAVSAEFVKKGDVVPFQVKEGWSRAPAPCDGVVITLRNGDIIFAPDLIAATS